LKLLLLSSEAKFLLLLGRTTIHPFTILIVVTLMVGLLAAATAAGKEEMEEVEMNRHSFFVPS
jgi:uncharacterized membrane protein